MANVFGWLLMFLGVLLSAYGIWAMIWVHQNNAWPTMLHPICIVVGIALCIAGGILLACSGHKHQDP
ncbi:MAG: hypothetical protein R3236_01510 [Phycisphaeraceae bacterium]|nr:hypothetical protein [Phycisphaeraceae bacterium]